MVFRERITELEKESITQHKENYMLNVELDYETTKATQLQSKNDQILAGVHVNKLSENKEREKIVAEYERRT